MVSAPTRSRSRSRSRAVALLTSALTASVVVVGLLPATASARSGAATLDPAGREDLAQYVNPYLGTKPGAADQGTGGGAGNDFPGADVPFGMVQWSPDTVKLQHGGYFYDDNQIKGFSLTHLSGAGCDTYQDIPFMPFVGQVTDSPAVNPDRYVANFSHSNENLAPGYYGVQLDNGANVQLSTTQRTGAGRFTYPAGQPSTLLVNTSGSIMGTDDAEATIGRDSIDGWASSGRFCGSSAHYRVYFHAEFDRPFASIGTWKNGAVTPGQATARGGALPKADPRESANRTPGSPGLRSQSVDPKKTTVSGPGSGAYVTFDSSKNAAVNVRVGLSFVSIDGAKSNLQAENAGKRSVDQVAAAARSTWNDRLNQIRVAGGTDEQRRTFYSSLYHALLQPNVFSDADGQYIGFDGRVHQTRQGHAAYTNFSGWDIYRSETQLLATLAPNETSDIAQSMVDYADQGGAWDRWTTANDFTGVMNGDPYHIIVSEAYAFGAKNFDAAHALKSMVKGATQPTTGYVERPGLTDYLKLGYVPGQAADTLEYTSADFAIAQLGQRLGDNATYGDFMKRAQYWQNLYNPATGYLQPRNRDGSFVEPFDPANPGGYVEGNGAQYSWMVPYDYAGLGTAFGGNGAVNSRLDTFFTKLNVGTHQPYAFLSNEPTLETPWIYDYTGAPYKTQATVRRAATELFNSGPGGLQGNDDLGQMGSWYVWAAMGMYPETPGRAELVTGSPMFSQVILTKGDGKKITINAPQAAPDAPYVTGLKVDGQSTTRPWLPESFVQNGGTLDYTLSAQPDTSWGAAPADAPPSFRDGETGLRTLVDPARVVAPAGGQATANVGAQDLSGNGATVSWTATPPSGIVVSPAAGQVIVPPGQKASRALSIAVASGTAEGTYRVPITFTSSDGSVLPPTTLQVLVAEPGSLRAAMDNPGISPDAHPELANYDGGGWSYSAEALSAAGLSPGGTSTVDGITHTWPNVPYGEPDNVTALGQTINLPNATAGATKLALLGSGTDGSSSGMLTVTFTDGTTSQATIGFSDWTLGGGGQTPSFGNRIVAKTPYRNQNGNPPQQITTYVFATAPIALPAGKTVRSVTLPAATAGGALHVFALTVG